MNQIQKLITSHINIWAASETGKKSNRGRSSNSKDSIYGIKKLRELIYDLAISGKLVTQNPSDEDAYKTIKRVTTWPKYSDQLQRNIDLLPTGWILTSIEAIAADTKYPVGDGDHGNIKPSSYTSSGIPYIRVADIGWGSFEPHGLVYIPESIHQDNLKSELFPGDVLIAKTGATIGKCCIIPASIKKANTTSSVGKVTVNKDLIIPEWLICYFLSSKFKEKMWSVSIKTAQPGFNIINLKKFKIPIPPLPEQKSIVDKIDELMALCDQLEQQHINSEEAHEKLVKVLLDTLTQSKDADEFKDNWQRIADHFDTLFTTEDSIDELKQTLLQIAVMGKLVPQDHNDEPASELIKRIQAEKVKLINEGKKKATSIPDDINSKPFKLPQGWEWSYLGEIFTLEYGNNLPEAKRTNSGEYPVYGSNGIVGTHNKSFVNSKCIVIGRKGSAGALNLSLSSGCCVTDVAYYCLPPPELDLIFTFYLFNTLGLDELGKGIKPGLNRNEAYGLILAIPPLEEQKRIVTKIEKLIALCDELKFRIQQASAKQKQIADVLVSQAIH